MNLQITSQRAIILAPNPTRRINGLQSLGNCIQSGPCATGPTVTIDDAVADSVIDGCSTLLQPRVDQIRTDWLYTSVSLLVPPL